MPWLVWFGETPPETESPEMMLPGDSGRPVASVALPGTVVPPGGAMPASAPVRGPWVASPVREPWVTAPVLDPCVVSPVRGPWLAAGWLAPWDTMAPGGQSPDDVFPCWPDGEMGWGEPGPVGGAVWEPKPVPVWAPVPLPGWAVAPVPDRPAVPVLDRPVPVWATA
jgi:hypothetical protein